MPDWRPALAMRELQDKARAVVRIDARQIALFDAEVGVFACANRCPHEGYPLSEGDLDGCRLTCNWHNWTFDLASGENLYGGDRLRVYPTEVRDGEIWVDVREPAYATRYSTIFDNLREAFDDNAYDRLARELARLQHLGADPLDALRATIEWSCERMEFGWTHAYAGMAEWLRLDAEFGADPALRLVCLTESMAHAAFDVLREDRYPFPDGEHAYEEAGLLAAIEARDEAAACAMVRGALAAGAGFAGLERGLTRAALAHYNDFGHALIYTTKAGYLIERLGEAAAPGLLLALVRELVYATREDRIPEFRHYAEALQRWGEGNEPLPPAGEWHRRGIAAALDLAVRSSAGAPQDLFGALLHANACNLLGFDLAREDEARAPVSDNVGWLDFTHGLTFANAVRKQCRRFPDLWPQGLLQITCFSGRNAAFTLEQPDLEGWRVEDADAFLARTVEGLFDHGVAEPIVSVHLVKTVQAVREELAAGVPGATRDVLLAGLNRFLHSPLKRRRVRRTAHQALQFVAKE